MVYEALYGLRHVPPICMMTTTTINPNSFLYKTLKEQVGLSGRERPLLERFAKLAFPGASGQAGGHAQEIYGMLYYYMSV